MIIEGLVSFAVSLFSTAISGLNYMDLPDDCIKVLGTICGYGSWIVGADLILLFCGMISFWFTFKTGAGLLKFIWQMLPFT